MRPSLVMRSEVVPDATHPARPLEPIFEAEGAAIFFSD